MNKFSLTLLALFSGSLLAQVQVSQVAFEKVGKVAQITVSEQDELFVINHKGELWQVNETETKLAEGFSTKIAPTVGYGRIAAGDAKGNFILWTADKTYTSTIPLAKQAGMAPLALATIAVTKQKNRYQLIRIEPKGDKAAIVATSNVDILPDAHPLQIDFKRSEAGRGHIAVLAKPDSTTYRHGVLGDDIEAAEIHYLERHTLEPLVEKISEKGLVFEANRLEHFPTSDGAKLVSVMSGQGDGGRAVLINVENGKLKVQQSSTALPSNRWQSPFVFNGKLYAVQMPHLRGRLVEYSVNGNKLTERFIQDGLSNHAYGDYETNLTAVTQQFALIPQRNYRNLATIDTQGRFTTLETKLPAEIRKSRSGKNKAYLLLDNGEVWVAEDK